MALADFNGDGKTDIVYGNWNGPHRLYLQDSAQKFRVRIMSAVTESQIIRKAFLKDHKVKERSRDAIDSFLL